MGEHVDRLVDQWLELSTVERVRAYMRRINGRGVQVKAYTRNGSGNAGVFSGPYASGRNMASAWDRAESASGGKMTREGMDWHNDPQHTVDPAYKSWRNDPQHNATPRNSENVAKADGRLGGASQAHTHLRTIEAYMELEKLNKLSKRTPAQEARRRALMAKTKGK